jgi:RNA polymerase sigma-70 factor (ECF subfamily)
LLKRTGVRDVADELCQTVFLKCFERLNHYNASQASVHTWVFTIARNTLIDYYRKSKSESTPDMEEVPASDITSDTEALTRARLDTEYVAKLLALLSPEEADVMTLRAIDEMAYGEIARIIGKSEEATRRMYSRALEKLRGLVHKNVLGENT